METKEQIIIAAISAAGPQGDDLDAWRLRVLENAGSFTAMLAPTSDVSKVIDSVQGSKVFPATILAIKKEDSSTRGLATLKTRVSDRNPEGTEQARTERSDSPIGMAMARKLRGLRYHKVLVWVDVQTMSNSTNKVRVISHVEDLGEDPDFAEELESLRGAVTTS
jgi:hypothetical protein